MKVGKYPYNHSNQPQMTRSHSMRVGEYPEPEGSYYTTEGSITEESRTLTRCLYQYTRPVSTGQSLSEKLLEEGRVFHLMGVFIRGEAVSSRSMDSVQCL